MTRKSSSPLADAYLRLMQLTRALRELPGSPSLDANEIELLNMLAIEWRAGRPCTVRGAMGIAALGSPATLHRRVKKLMASGMIEVRKDPDRLKAKLLVPTSAALEYFSQLGASILTIQDGQAR
jgi:hypothetical protein